MLVEVTYACKMGCTHCLSDCKPDGEHMTLEVFEDVLKFMIKNQIPTWSFSGGEMFEHPDILKMLSLIESYWKTLPIKYPITFATNGRELVRNKKIYHAVSEFLKHCGKRYVMIQVTDDPRFYPDPLTDNEKYWLSKLGVIIDTVPSDQNNKSHCLYPQGRALKNYSDEYWNTIAPKCINCILITKQKPEATLKDLVNILLSNGKVCTPVLSTMFFFFEMEEKYGMTIKKIVDDDGNVKYAVVANSENRMYDYLSKWHDAYICKKTESKLVDTQEERERILEDYARWKSKFPKSIENSKDLKENQKQKLKKKIEELQSEYERLH